MRKHRRRRRPALGRLGGCLLFTVLLVIGLYTLTQSRWFLRLVYPIKYEDIILEKSREYSLDPILVFAMVKVESGFNSQATSAKGARGLMQLMPETARWISTQRKLGYSPELLYDPQYNLDFGCWYLASLYREFRGDTLVSLAAYNGGRGNVRRWLESNQWSGEHETIERIPFPETRRYLERVDAMARIYRRLYPEYAEKGM
jgi:soluble lytic murein transglycosylase